MEVALLLWMVMGTSFADVESDLWALCEDESAAVHETGSGEFWWESLSVLKQHRQAWRSKQLAVSSKKKSPMPEVLLDTARNYLGVPYLWGGEGRGGLDCSGFTNKVYAKNGYDLPRNSRQQFRVGMKVSRWNLKAGDLVFFSSEPSRRKITHVGIYVDDDEFIHAARGKGEVTYDRLTSSYYSRRFRGGRRFLSLNPGRYSAKDGTARRSRLYDDPKQLADAKEDATILNELGLDGSGDTVAEHKPGEKPIQLVNGFVKGSINQVGPALISTQETALGLRFAGGVMKDVSALVIAPEFTYFGHENAFQLSIGIPLEIPITGFEGEFGKRFKEGWGKLSDYTKVINKIQFGQKESQLYIELSRTLSGSLGHGQIMRYYTPNIGTSYLPNYTIKRTALSAAVDGFLDSVGSEFFIDDVISPHVLGALFFFRPSVLLGSPSEWKKRFSVAATYALDMDAPFVKKEDGSYEKRSLHGIGVDIEYKYVKTKSVDIKSYLDLSGLVYDGGTGFGVAFGTLIRTNLQWRGTHVLRGRLEIRASNPNFIPSYFDTTYPVTRYAAPVDDYNAEPITKLGLLDELKNDPSRWGFYGELVYRFSRRVSFVTSYEDGDAFGEIPPSESYSGRNFMLSFKVDKLYLPRSTRYIDFYLAYHLRNFKDTTGVFNLKRPNEYIFSSLSMRVSRFLEFHLSLRKGVNGDSRQVGGFDIMAGATAKWEL